MLSSLLGFSRRIDLHDILSKGALVLDVRSADDFRNGHVPGAMNIPIEQLDQQMASLRRDRPIVTCCKDGHRSAKAARMLVDHGFMATNGGPWEKVRKALA